jgi:hypothetical protein
LLLARIQSQQGLGLASATFRRLQEIHFTVSVNGHHQMIYLEFIQSDQIMHGHEERSGFLRMQCITYSSGVIFHSGRNVGSDMHLLQQQQQQRNVSGVNLLYAMR